MKLVNGNLYFKKISENNDKYSYLNDNISCDILIVGAGVSGMITAYYMAEEGYNVVVVDKNIVGYGSTSANVGIVDLQFTSELGKLSKLIGEKKTRKCFNLMVDGLNELEKITLKLGKTSNINFKRLNSIYYTDKYMGKNQVVKEYNCKINMGIGTNFVTDNNLIDLKYGLQLKNMSATMNIYEFTKELASYISKKENVKIYEHTEIEKFECSEDNALCVTSNKFKIVASKAIITEGAEVVKNFPDMPIELYRTYNIVTEKIEGLEGYDTNFTARNVDMPFNYFRFTEDNRIIFGGQISKVTDKDSDEIVAKQLSNIRYRRLFKELQETFCELKNISAEYCFNGVFAETKDNLPLIDELPNMPNVYCNLSYGINGVLFSVIGAKMLKEINREYYARDMHMFGIKR